MPNYEYHCQLCGRRFDQFQNITEAPLRDCPDCGGEVRRVLSGGAGFILKGPAARAAKGSSKICSLESEGRTCCGRNERCGQPPCKD